MNKHATELEPGFRRVSFRGMESAGFNGQVKLGFGQGTTCMKRPLLRAAFIRACVGVYLHSEATAFGVC